MLSAKLDIVRDIVALQQISLEESVSEQLCSYIYQKSGVTQFL